MIDIHDNSIYICMWYVCMHVCVCVCLQEHERAMIRPRSLEIYICMNTLNENDNETAV